MPTQLASAFALNNFSFLLPRPSCSHQKNVQPRMLFLCSLAMIVQTRTPSVQKILKEIGRNDKTFLVDPLL
jgi:hypothetical protein